MKGENESIDYLVIHMSGNNAQNTKAFSYDVVNITLHFFLKDIRPMLPPAMNHSIAVS